MRYRRAHILFAFLGIGLSLAGTSQFAWAEEPPVQAGGTAAAIGPDVIVSQLGSTVLNWGVENTLTGYISGLSIGTTSCSVGDVPIQWQPLPSVQHPVIRGSMFRLKNNRFEQIGISWVKHGFFAVNDPLCGLTCTAPADHEGLALYPGCSDPYGANLNGTRSYLGPASQINAYTGTFSLPVTHPAASGVINGRLQVHNVDLDTTLNAGARYYVESQYIAADDAAAGNANNNASYQRVNVIRQTTLPDDSCTGTDPNRFCVTLTDFTHDTLAGIRAWKDFDPSVVETDAQVPGEGLFILSARVSDLGTGFFHYEYALHNLNSDRSGKSFTVPMAIGASVTNVGFHDVDYHSGEPYDNVDWQVSVLSGKVIWTTQDYSVNVNANALRWGTLYNFRFDSNAPPGNTTIVLDLFKPGAPDKININTVGPIVGFIDCNGNGVADACDVDCGGVGCTQPCGTKTDCNHNSVPDECETDCNENDIADTCDVTPRCIEGDDAGDACEFDSDCDSNDCAPFSEDCNENTVPDECEEDCNHNGIPDNCETIIDCDDDGVNDCEDLCPCTTPLNGCDPPPFTCCYVNGQFSIPDYPYSSCLSLPGGMPHCDAENPGSCGEFELPPACPTSFCRQGCLVGDGDGDGDFDLADYDALMDCYSGEQGSPAFVEPSSQCRTWFDYDENGAVDLADVEQFRRQLAGPGGF